MNDTVKQDPRKRNGISRIIGALKGGRHLSLKDGREFEVSQMHTCFCLIQKRVLEGKIKGYVMLSRWVNEPNGVRYKEYWFEDAED